MSTSTPPVPAVLLTPLEQEVLDEYQRLLSNLQTLNNEIAELADAPASEVMENLRALERKTSLVFTLLKASVYSLILQQQLEGEQHDDGMSEG
ncbi:DASH complex subunit Dad3 [Geopyxis carbonaria]|nr:DASH complex subunit Dad3 [Geopyxis carbonaria]